ncbi:MAG: hypothetical protein DCF25_15780 [Leptolyngbya foveolarum]|uniref:Uncharacterized protein n=1 Tax=Leptolyngbya foveolarum TaxID=47253 RepID=A0A2W4VN70_9CYAN|nr:MAG: hypothetical protein DCF25_15780 [Leptolyngbya foveolarum]
MPSDPLFFELEFEIAPKEQVVSLLATIEYYRAKKKSLHQIYLALCKRDDFSMSFALFKHYYYQQRKQKGNQKAKRSPAASRTKVSLSKKADSSELLPVVVSKPKPDKSSANTFERGVEG